MLALQGLNLTEGGEAVVSALPSLAVTHNLTTALDCFNTNRIRPVDGEADIGESPQYQSCLSVL